MSTDASPPPESHASKWPARVTSLCVSWREATTERERNRVLSELWVLLNAAIARYVRSHGGSYGFVDAEDVRDIASEKAMVFLHSLQAGSVESTAPEPGRVCAYLSTLARNGLVDTLRRRGRKQDLERRLGDQSPWARPLASHEAETNLQHDEFIEALQACLNTVSPRARSAWVLRTFLDLPSKTIASHPDVRMTAVAVDMMLSRTRQALRKCMMAKGFDATDAPRGTFVTLWETWKLGGGPRSSDDGS